MMTALELERITGGRLRNGDPHTPIYHISIDSRDVDKGNLFVPLKGERVDAHRFLADTANGKAGCVLCSEDIAPTGDAAWIQVEDTYRALIDIGVANRQRMSPQVVAVTGSVGKTTTREMVATAIGASYRTFRTTRNYNSDIGVPIMLYELDEQDEMAVLELGMSDFGEMEKIARMAKPDIAIITNIGVAHIAQLKTRENICKEKLSVTKGMNPGSLLILNGDDDQLSKVNSSIGHDILFYGFGYHNDYRAENVIVTEKGTSFDAVCPDGRVNVNLPVNGNHMVMNALAAIAAAHHFDVSLEDAAHALAGFQTFAGRQQIYKIRDYCVIDDSYNASPDSMRAALGVLASMPCEGRRIAVLSDMLELGLDERIYHHRIGEYAATLGLDCLICVGNLAAEYGKGALNINHNLEVRFFASKDEAFDHLKDSVSAGDLLLFKGSNSTRIGQIITRLKEE